MESKNFFLNPFKYLTVPAEALVSNRSSNFGIGRGNPFRNAERRKNMDFDDPIVIMIPPAVLWF
jgi:hypothetical protein